LTDHGRFLYDLYSCRDSDDFRQFLDVIGPDGMDLINDIKFEELLSSSVVYSVKSGTDIRPRRQDKVLVVPQFVIVGKISYPQASCQKALLIHNVAVSPYDW